MFHLGPIRLGICLSRLPPSGAWCSACLPNRLRAPPPPNTAAQTTPSRPATQRAKRPLPLTPCPLPLAPALKRGGLAFTPSHALSQDLSMLSPHCTAPFPVPASSALRLLAEDDEHYQKHKQHDNAHPKLAGPALPAHLRAAFDEQSSYSQHN